jgi:hypothetical protein
MAMGLLGYSDLLADRYLPLMMDGANRHWFNTLPPNNIDSWEEACATFIQHFSSAYTRATTIEDLERCVQGPRKLAGHVNDLHREHHRHDDLLLPANLQLLASRLQAQAHHQGQHLYGRVVRHHSALRR